MQPQKGNPVAPEVADFYTVESKDENRFSQYVKKIRLYDKKAGKLLPSAPYVLARAGISPKREDPLAGEPLNGSVYSGKPTEEQEAVFQRMKKRALSHGYRCGLVVMKTGKGKSHVIMRACAELPGHHLVLAHSVKTANELAQKFTEFCGMKAGMIGGGKKDVKFPVTVCTHDSFVAAGGKIGDFATIHYDEADFNLSPKMVSALCCSGARALYGYTGTPYRKDLDQKDMQKVFGESISSAEAAADPKKGYNITPEIRIVKYRNPTPYAFLRFDELKTQMVQDQTRLGHQIGYALCVMAEGRKCGLILTERVDEAAAYFEKLKEAGVNTCLVTGATKDSEDVLGISAVASYGGVIVGTVGKMARGADIPAVDTVFLFAALHFRGTVVQAVGRALRNYPGKTGALIVDWNDLPILYRQGYERRKAYSSEYGNHKSETHELKPGAVSGGNLRMDV